jgi:hypothetical protein
MQTLIRFTFTACIFIFPFSDALGKSCAKQSTVQNSSSPGKKLVSYDECVRQAQLDCEHLARQRKLINDAKDSFMKRCLVDFIGK